MYQPAGQKRTHKQAAFNNNKGYFDFREEEEGGQSLPAISGAWLFLHCGAFLLDHYQNLPHDQPYFKLRLLSIIVAVFGFNFR
jgi:hypothetical protein